LTSKNGKSSERDFKRAASRTLKKGKRAIKTPSIVSERPRINLRGLEKEGLRREGGKKGPSSVT